MTEQNVKLLSELGLTKAANKLHTAVTLKKKLALAYEHYRFVEPGIFIRFQEQLRNKTIKSHPCTCTEKTRKQGYCSSCGNTGIFRKTYDTLAFTKIEDYPEVPPMDCLLELKKAKDLDIFDRFEVAKVQTVEVRPDPIIFGLIDGCVDKFFITQWLDDVKIEDILKQNEG